MALTFCPECSNRVSTLAASCPHCGAPAASVNRETSAAPPTPTPHVTIERTNKSIKLGLLLCAAAFWIGLIGLFGANGEQETATCSWMMVIGGVGWFVMKIARWWENG